jgi:hypothetical protein
MAQAVQENTTSRGDFRPLSQLFTDPIVADSFRRAERDLGDAFAVVPVRPIILAGGAAETRELATAPNRRVTTVP